MGRPKEGCDCEAGRIPGATCQFPDCQCSGGRGLPCYTDYIGENYTTHATGASSGDHTHPISTFPVFDQALEALTRQIEAQMGGKPVREMAWRVCFPPIGNHQGGVSTDHVLDTEVERISAAYVAAGAIKRSGFESSMLSQLETNKP